MWTTARRSEQLLQTYQVHFQPSLIALKLPASHKKRQEETWSFPPMRCDDQPFVFFHLFCFALFLNIFFFCNQICHLASGATSRERPPPTSLSLRSCTQGEIVTHTAWLNRSSILYAGDEKWSVDPRVSLVTLNQEEFTIKIENVAMTDEGQYVCAVQTSRRPTTNVVHVHVQVPPKIINLSRDIVVNEGANVTVLCQANGKPQPSVSWKLISSSGDLATDDEYLEIPSITRHRAGTYECTAVNDIDTDTETIDITVNYAPTVSDGRDIGVTLGQRGVLECEADAVPEADFEWYKDDRRFINGFDGMEIVNTGSLSKLTFFNVSDGHYGNYTCVAINKLGSSNTSFVMYGPRAVQDGSGSTLGVQLDICLLFIVFLPFLLKF
ncbi:opioid-binding protein/cell adhesion molecule homolog isoform X4 [Phyllopteryx taeniolatus]|uniref:opioid-binding protein/cell adhesion molecule homolog isoform X4 n=1 Tax=Phyllopteryx taeniolatus TaxID=161469 RepID=UPI002AD3EDF0|nr:opioid-binding protein/cell adhesion molecule homolog isoform X4 [Phyllopteryx taeniolatus]